MDDQADVGGNGTSAQFVRYADLLSGKLPGGWVCINPSCSAVFEAAKGAGGPKSLSILSGWGIRRCNEERALPCRFVQCGSYPARVAQMFLQHLPSVDYRGEADRACTRWGAYEAVCSICGVVCSSGREPRGIRNFSGERYTGKVGKADWKNRLFYYVSKTGDRCNCGATHCPEFEDRTWEEPARLGEPGGYRGGNSITTIGGQKNAPRPFSEMPHKGPFAWWRQAFGLADPATRVAKEPRWIGIGPEVDGNLSEFSE